MENRIVFGKWESVCFLINMICTKIFLNFNRVMTESAGTAGWILAVYVSVLAFLGFFIISGLYKGFEGKDLLDIGEKIGGNAGRIITGVIILIFLLFIVPVVLREFDEDMKIIALPVSPISFVSLFFMAGMIGGAYLGLEAVVRFQAIAIPIVAASFILIIISITPFFDTSNLLPILGTGINDIFGKGSLKISIYAEIVFLFLLAPYIKTYRNFKVIGYTSLGFSAFFLIISTAVYVMVIPYPTAMESFLPIYELARLINVGMFFQRVESLFMIIWVVSALMYLSTGFFTIIYIFKKTFKLEYYRPLIMPFAILVFTLSLIPPNLITSVELETRYFRNVSWIITFVFTIILLLIGYFARKKALKGKARNG